MMFVCSAYHELCSVSLVDAVVATRTQGCHFIYGDIVVLVGGRGGCHPFTLPACNCGATWNIGLTDAVVAIRL